MQRTFLLTWSIPSKVKLKDDMKQHKRKLRQLIKDGMEDSRRAAGTISPRRRNDPTQHLPDALKPSVIDGLKRDARLWKEHYDKARSKNRELDKEIEDLEYKLEHVTHQRNTVGEYARRLGQLLPVETVAKIASEVMSMDGMSGDSFEVKHAIKPGPARCPECRTTHGHSLGCSRREKEADQLA